MNSVFSQDDIILSATCSFLSGSVFVLHLWLPGHFDLLQVDCYQCQFTKCKCDIFVFMCQDHLGRLQGMSLFTNYLGNNNIARMNIGRLNSSNSTGTKHRSWDIVGPKLVKLCDQFYIIIGHHDQTPKWLSFCREDLVCRPCQNTLEKSQITQICGLFGLNNKHLLWKLPHTAMSNQIDQFWYIKIQPNTVDLSTRLRGINPTNYVVIPKSLVLMCCFGLNFCVQRTQT